MPRYVKRILVMGLSTAMAIDANKYDAIGVYTIPFAPSSLRGHV